MAQYLQLRRVSGLSFPASALSFLPPGLIQRPHATFTRLYSLLHIQHVMSVIAKDKGILL